MHQEAHDWVKKHAATNGAVDVLDIGGRNINGSVVDLFPNATRYLVIDPMPGDNVNIIADAATWQPDREYDIVAACEVFEHTTVWREICQTAFFATKPGGKFVVTCAAPGRPQHSAITGGPLEPGEYYGNVSGKDLKETLTGIGFIDIIVDQTPCDPRDTRSIATRPLES